MPNTYIHVSKILNTIIETMGILNNQYLILFRLRHAYLYILLLLIM